MRADPVGGERGRIFFPEELAARFIRVTFQADATVADVGQQKRRNPKVIINNLGLGEAGERKDDTIRAGYIYSSAFGAWINDATRLGPGVSVSRADP